MLSLAILMLTIVTNTAQAKESTVTGAKELDVDKGDSGPLPAMPVDVRVGSGTKVTSEETSSKVFSTARPTASVEKTTETVKKPSMSSEKFPSPTTMPSTKLTTKSTINTTTTPTTKPTTKRTTKWTTKRTKKLTRKSTLTTTTKPISTPTPQKPLPPDSLLCTLREGFTRSTMQFPPDGLCTITTFYDLIKDADVTPILTYREDFSYFLETASGHKNTEYGIGIGYR
ncbi:uncharacterized protein LOC142790042 [Rhipicephalus microplus]|uniref:uncharacterized protein LOC142790042 n=1 Tax=Rhipicephalus microplus TaxID=6941 RepID=UPI003F6D83E9